MKRNYLGWTLLVIANVLVLCVLGFYQSVGTAQQREAQNGQPPFQNAVEQRQEMIRELKEIAALLKEQNSLLRNGPGKTPVHDSRQK